ncbi:Haloacid dehalogenase-like hydrolase superfamily protein [Perilla frutescens var. hirtella]|uniref:Trehalose 6-phosphate phosphatase n=1 Tax=Perilla frutescens var. hirtella TaxID=608512 RepID=A0AAD4NXV0_PERFH|nr:Haloacid dehalogenase-like hydrolase superfamily protein [Perilla frutescens var. hirtella]
MVIPDAKSGIPMSFSVAMPDSALFPPNGHFPWKRLLKKLGTNTNGARINALLDSMRASSPTRRPAEGEDHGSWILHHPSALNMFEEIMSASKGKQIVVFLDYDGTLSPIVEDPDRAFITNEMREAVRDVSKFFPTAIVSGRCRAKVHDFVKLSELYYAGSHGMDIKGPSKGHRQKKGNQTVLCQPAREFLPIIDEVYRALIEKVKHIPGAKVENNRFCLSVHYRCVDEKKWVELADEVKLVIKDYPQLRLNHGRKVFEIRPTIKWDKGNAVEFLLESLGYADSNDVLPVYIGDDRTDEDAFRVLRQRGRGLGILVSKVPKETNASYSLQEPTEASYALPKAFSGVEEAKKMSLLRH